MSERKLVGTGEMFKKALAGGYAIGAYNVNNMEILQGIAEAAEETQSPIILQVSAGARKYANQTYLIKLVEAALATTTVPIALHLDHGADFEICKACIDGGFSSVMIDGSRFPLEENIKLTKQVVDYAHPRGVSVEAELGKLAGVEDDVKVHAKDSTYTDPAEAARFVKETGCDSLAVAIGTSHGAYKFKGEAKLDFERLAEIKKAVNEAVGYDHGKKQAACICKDIAGGAGQAAGGKDSACIRGKRDRPGGQDRAGGNPAGAGPGLLPASESRGKRCQCDAGYRRRYPYHREDTGREMFYFRKG